MPTKLAKDVMTPDPVCCRPHMPIDEVARLMVDGDFGEIPVIDSADHPIGVVTDRDIVRRIVAQGKNPIGYTAETCMTQPVVTVRSDARLEDVVSIMEQHQIRRVPVVDEEGRCTGIISQADVARQAPAQEVAALLREVSRE